MRNADFAEWMLSQVSSRERAAATVGDLLEEISRRGVSWFWVSVAQTVWSLVWREFNAHRGRMLRYGAAGAVIAFAIPSLLAVVYGIGPGILIATGTVLSMTLWVSVTQVILEFTLWQLFAIPYVVGAGWARRRRLAAA
jgi:hypothetical protein